MTWIYVSHLSNNIVQVAKHMQGLVSTWEGLLYTTWGALVPNKCFWYLIDFKHRNGKWTYCPLDCLPGSLFVRNNKGPQTLIPWLEVSEVQCTLGVCIAPDGNTLTELYYLISVANDWHDKMAWSQLSQHEATFSLHKVIFHKLHYPLLATTFSPDQCKSIMVPILKHSLPAAGIVQTYLCSLVHGPIQYAGLNIPNLHTEQTICHILQVLSALDPSDVMAFLLWTCGKLMHLELVG